MLRAGQLVRMVLLLLALTGAVYLRPQARVVDSDAMFGGHVHGTPLSSFYGADRVSVRGRDAVIVDGRPLWDYGSGWRGRCRLMCEALVALEAVLLLCTNLHRVCYVSSKRKSKWVQARPWRLLV